MTIGRNQYSEADLLRMQQDAEARVREMQGRARRTVEETNQTGAFQPRNRNWSSNPGIRSGRNMPGNRGGQGGRQNNAQQNNRQHNWQSGQQNGPSPRTKPEAPPEEAVPVSEPPPQEEAPSAATETKKSGTIVGDIMDALGLDEDYLLIIGLILILVNQRADTTLILALAYLLI